MEISAMTLVFILILALGLICIGMAIGTKETERKLKETERKLKETERKLKETENKLKETENKQAESRTYADIVDETVRDVSRIISMADRKDATRKETKTNFSDDRSEELWCSLSAPEREALLGVFWRAYERSQQLNEIIREKHGSVYDVFSWFFGYQDALIDLFGFDNMVEKPMQTARIEGTEEAQGVKEIHMIS